MKRKYWGLILAGFGAGTVNGLLGSGGGMILIPLLTLLTDLTDQGLFSGSIAVILPVCLVSLTVTGLTGGLSWKEALPYLPASALGGYLAVRFGRKIPAVWLHRVLGILILWGGVRYLC